MTDNEIINALECCAERISCDQHCPYWHTTKGCDYVQIKVILDLIKRRQAEIEAYKYYYDECLKDLKNANAEIDRLRKTHIFLDYPIEEIKAEAVKEFVERLKGITSRQFKLGVFFGEFKVNDFDNLVKEMVGAESG